MPEEHRTRAKSLALDTDAQRARAIVESLRAGEPGPTEVFDAFWELDALPVDDVRDALAAWVGPLPDPDRLDAATRLAHGFPPPPLRLRTIAVAKDADILDLGPLAEEQLRLAGKSWDGADLSPEDRLDGELEGSFAGTLERRVLADVDAPGDTPLFDVLLFGEDSGVVFAGGTTDVVALIAYRKVETRDRRTRTAIEDALAAPGALPLADSSPLPPSLDLPPEEKETPAETAVGAGESANAEEVRAENAPEKAAPKKAPEKAAAKKAPAKKAAARNAPAKTAAAKKAPAKKVVAKKAPAKKAAAKKAPAKRTTPKKAPASRAAGKKASTKKAVKAKSAARRAPKASAKTSKRTNASRSKTR